MRFSSSTLMLDILAGLRARCMKSLMFAVSVHHVDVLVVKLAHYAVHAASLYADARSYGVYAVVIAFHCYFARSPGMRAMRLMVMRPSASRHFGSSRRSRNMLLVRESIILGLLFSLFTSLMTARTVSPLR